MDSYSDEEEYGPEHIPMFQNVVDMFEGKPDFQRIVRLGILANMGYDVEYDDTGAEDCDFDRWVHRHNRSGVHGYGFSGNRASSSSPQPPARCHGATDAKAGNLGASKEEEKAEKKRLKRQRRKERKRSEKEKEERNAEEKDKKAENERPKADVKEQAAAKESGGSDESEDNFSDEDLSGSEELDMTSTFVSKARSKLEQKPKPEKERKMPAKEAKSSPEKPKREAEKKPASPSRHSVEENIRMSTQFANLGNTYANAGDFKTAVLFYADAIKHNPREYRLFGNRSFCFERMRLYMKALEDAELSLSMCPGWVKGLFRKGKALAGLKRYEEAEQAFRQVLDADSSRVDATEELMRVQIAQLMGHGYTSEQSAQALNAHKSVKKALHFLRNLNHQPANVSSSSSPKPRNAAESAVRDKRSPPASQKGLYPIWVGNLFCSVTEPSLEQLFNKVGPVNSVRLLTYKRCAFVNFTKREDCEEAIRRFNGFDLNGTKIVVRYPDRIPPGMGMSSTALTSDGL